MRGLGVLLLAVFLAGAAVGCSPATHSTTGTASPPTSGSKQPDDKGKPKPPDRDPG